MNLNDEHVLRELNLYPLWVRRSLPVPEDITHHDRSPDVGLESNLQETETNKMVPAVGLKPDLQAAVGRSDFSPTTNPDPQLVKIQPTDWPTLKQQVRDCTVCKLRAGCTQTVLGVGDEQADWLFVGEGPGADEDVRGEPFVGQAGKLLDNMLLAIGLKRGANVYIANIVKCRPADNRNPQADEIAACMPYLYQQIALIQPKRIVALGKTAASALLGGDAPLGSLRGTVHDFNGIPLIVTYHPAYLLRSPNEKARAWQDLTLARSLAV